MRRSTDERGIALVAALLVTMLMSALVAGFLVMVNADQVAGGIERDQTQAYAAAHAGVEKLTADLGDLFAGNFSPTPAQLGALDDAGTEPNLPGITYVRPDGSRGYRIAFRDDDGDGQPDVDNPDGTTIAAGPYQGLVGLITPYDVEVTARTMGNAEVRMRRTMQTIAIPVFQFGLFSENNLSFFAGPNFSFGGRIHTNQHLFLKQEDGATLTLADRVTAVGEVIRTHLSNGQTTHNGTVRVAKAAGCPSAPTAINGNCFVLAANQGSLVGNLGTAENDPTWTNVSVGTSNGWLKNGRTGARRLDLPIVSDGASPMDLVRRPPVGEVTSSAVGRQRFFNMATLRILLSDQPADLTTLPDVVWTAGVSPVRLAGAISVTPRAGLTLNQPFAESTGVFEEGYRTTLGTPSLDGYILINRQDRNGDWTDVTMEILGLGFSGGRLSAGGTIDSAHLSLDCVNPHPNAVIRVQRYKDTFPTNGGARNSQTDGCPIDVDAVVPSSDVNNYWPNILYDAREGMLRDDQGNRPRITTGFGTGIRQVFNNQQRLYWGGVMHYVELDVFNLKRWLEGTIGTSNSSACVNGAGPDTCAMDITGFVVYFSDRRTNRDLGSDGVIEESYGGAGFTYADDRETGEFGFEDNINPASASSTPNGVLDAPFVDAQGTARWAEDVNENGLPETYGGQPRLVPGRMINVASPYTPNGNVYNLYQTPIDRNVARVNRAFFFRRAIKLVNGGRGRLPANGTQGLTVASENPVYVQGNYNACSDTAVPNGTSPACAGGVGFGSVPGKVENGGDHVSAAIIADAVTFLSNSWNDIRSFVNPHDATITGFGTLDGTQGNRAHARQAATSWYRVAIIGGKGLSFARPTSNGNDHNDFGTDGGAHNFIRYLETWSDATLNYRGSLVSFYTSRQAVGTYKCCDIVYGAPTRGYNFDTDFLLPRLLPPRTPMFRDINTLTFRQILRPTQ